VKEVVGGISVNVFPLRNMFGNSGVADSEFTEDMLCCGVRRRGEGEM